MKNASLRYESNFNHAIPLFKIISSLIIIFVFYKSVQFPVWPTLLTLALFFYSIALYFKPIIWLLVIPALLPNLDLATWSGRFFLSEFDYFILITLAINLWHQCLTQPFLYAKKSFTALLLFFLIFYVISLFIGLLPLQPIDNNAFSNYYSNYNSLRVAKGVMWSFLLLPVLNYHLQHYPNSKNYFAVGMLLGLIGVIIFSLIERILFPGLMNFTTDYRITGMFSSMHTGGGHIDSYLVIAIPFILFLFINPGLSFFRVAIGISLFIASLYVLMVTFSRGPYIAFCIQFILIIFCLLWVYSHKKSFYRKQYSLIILLILIIPIISIPIFKGDYIQQRFNQIDKDFNIRLLHWKDAIKMMDSDISTTLFGMGLGAYPRTYFWNNSENTIPATYSFKKEQETSFLRMWGGDSLYMEQKVAVSPDQNYILSLTLKSNTTNPSITIPICEKALLYSFNCNWQTINFKTKKNQWVSAKRKISFKKSEADAGKVLGSLSRRPTKLAIYNASTDAVIDIKNISLYDSSQTNLLQNSTFSQGIDNWFFSTDNHLPWHSKNIFIQVFFDQGLLGLTLFIIILACIYIRQFKALKNNGYYNIILITSLTGFLIVGVVASPFDAPRLTLLLFFIIFLSLFETNQNNPIL